MTGGKKYALVIYKIDSAIMRSFCCRPGSSDRCSECWSIIGLGLPLECEETSTATPSSACQSCWTASLANQPVLTYEELYVARVIVFPAPRRLSGRVIFAQIPRLQAPHRRRCHRDKPHTLDWTVSHEPASEQRHPCILGMSAVESSTMEC